MRYTDKAVLQIILIFVEANEDLFFGKKSADISCSLAPRVFLYSQIQLRFGNSCDFYVSLIFLCV